MKRQIIFYIAIFFPNLLLAQNLVYTHYNTEKGLIQNQIIEFLIDQNQFLWIGTKGGVSIFDGVNFINFGYQEGLLDVHTHDLAEDKHGDIWVLSKTSLTQFHHYKPINHNIKQLIPNLLMLNLLFYDYSRDCIYIDCIADKEKLLLKYKDNKLDVIFRITEKINEVEFNYLPDINKFSFGNILFDPISNKTDTLHYTLSNIIQLNHSRYYFISPDNNSIILLNKSFNPTDTINRKFISFKKKKSGYDSIIDFSLHQKNLKINQYMVFEQINKNIEFLGSENGIYKYGISPFEYFAPQENLFKEIWAINELNNEMYFFSYQGGYTKLNNTTKTANFVPNQIAYYFGHSTFDKHSIIQGHHKGLEIISAHANKTFKEQMSDISFIYFDSLAENWLICHSQGLSIMDKQQKFTHYRNDAGYDLSYPLAIEKDKYDSLWIVGSRRINKFKNGKIVKLNDKIVEQSMLTLKADHKKNIWLGGRNGLFFYDYTHFRRIDHPKLNTTITAVYQLNKQKLLIGTINGMAMLDLQLFYQHDSLFIHFYDNSNGFKNLEVQQNSFFISKDNFLWIPLTTGVFKVDTSLLKFNKNKPIARIHKIINLQEKNDSLSEQVVERDKLIVFEPNQKNFRIEYTAFEYQNPEKLSFTHRLLGLEKKWSKISGSRYVEYTYLPPGEYIFELIAYNENMIPSEKSTFQFRIQKAWYQLQIVYIVIFLLLIFNIFMAYRFYYKQKTKKRDEIKNREIELRQAQAQVLMNQLDNHFIFNAISAAANLSFSSPDQQYIYLADLANLLRYLLKNKDEISVALKEEIKHIYILANIQSLRFSGRIKLELKQSVKEEDMHNLKVPILFIFHFVDNAIKYSVEKTSRIGLVIIRIKYADQDYICVEIEDNGIGIDNSKTSISNTGMGLASNKKLISILNLYNQNKQISYEIVSKKKPETGTIVKVYIPFNYNYKLYETIDNGG
jgi:anti-sigma regulatory factor (Ser/Thr protein kinase)